MKSADNGASLVSWDNPNLFYWLDELTGPDEVRHKPDESQVYICQIPKSKEFASSRFYSQCLRITYRYTYPRYSTAVEIQ